MKKGITAMIIDDEREAIDYLEILLNESFPEVDVVSTACSSDEAIKKVFVKHPDLIFLDIEIDSLNGFDIVEKLEQENHFPYIIFITAYNKYAINAFKVNALDYLLKPVEVEDLKRAINKYSAQKEKDLQYQNIQNLLNNYHPKIRFNTRNGFILINPDEIVYCQADGNYSEIYVANQSKKVVSSNLKNLFKQLPNPQFKRISRYNIINEKYLIEVDRGKKECKLLVDGQEIVLNFSPKLFAKLS